MALPAGRAWIRPPRGPRLLAWAAPLLVFALTVAVFCPTLNNGLTNWDDDANLTNNDAYRGLGWKQLRWMFGSSHRGHYHPLTWVTFAIDHYLWDDQAFGFHLTNLLLHGANAVVFYFLSLRLYRLAMPQRAGAAAGLHAGAALSAAVFALHPLRVESVAWATERRDVLSGLFFLLALLAYLRMHHQRGAGRAGWYAAALVLFLLALLSKVMVVSLPVVLMVLDTYPLRRVRLGEWFSRVGARAWLEKLPFFALGLIATGIAANAQTDVDAMISFSVYGVGPRVAQAVYGLGFYVRKTLLPVGLATLYELGTGVPFADARFVASAALVATTTGFLVIAGRRWPAGLATWACYALILVPVSGLFQNGPQIAADRYSYLACLGWAVLVGAGLVFCWSVRPRQTARMLAVGSLALAALAALTIRQTCVWRDSLTLWTRTLEVEPQSRMGRYNVGQVLEERGRYEEAAVFYRQVVAVAPERPRHHFALGNALSHSGRLDEAIASYWRAIDLQPDYVEAYLNLGNALLRRGAPHEAAEAYAAALSYDANYVDARYNLGQALAAIDRPAEAIEQYRRVLAAQPARQEARLNLAALLARQRDFKDAIAVLREGLQVAPASMDVANMLAFLLATCPEQALRDGREAVRLAQRTCEAVRHGDAGRLYTLSVALAESGRFAEAIAAGERALELAESHGQAALAAQIRRTLVLFEAGQPYHQGPGGH